MTYSDGYLAETHALLDALDPSAIERLASGLARVREGGGRLFVLGVGGSAGHAGHAVNDFRKLCRFEAYAPTDMNPAWPSVSSPSTPVTKFRLTARMML
jgi:D-sedoheptulose 7-phosphate isomerase